MSQASEPAPDETLAPKASRTKLIAIVIAIAVALVAVAAGAVFYLGLGRNPCTAPAMVADVSSEGLGSPQTASSPADRARPAESRVSPTQAGTITVGFSISLTGKYTVEGTNSLRGLNTTEYWINTNGGITVGGQTYNVQLKYYDDQSDGQNIQTLYSTLVQQDGAEFLLAPYSTALTTTAAPYADQFDRVMMSHGGAADTIWTSTQRTNLVQVLSPASAYLKGSVDWLKANHPTDRIAVIHESDSFSTLASQSALDYAKSLGLNVVYNASYPTGTADLSTQLNAAKLACADALIGGGHFNDGLLIMNQLKTIWTPKFVSILVAVTEPSFQSQLQASANRVVGPSQWESRVT